MKRPRRRVFPQKGRPSTQKPCGGGGKVTVLGTEQILCDWSLVSGSMTEG